MLADDHDTAVIVNELGTVAIDHTLVSEVTEDVTLLTSGCLCCQIGGDWLETLDRVVAYQPRRIVIELSGGADPRPVLHALAFGTLATRFTVGSAVATLDVIRGDTLLDDPLARAQLECTGRVLLTKADLQPERLDPLRRRLTEELPSAEIRVRSGDPFEGVPAALDDPTARVRWLAPVAHGHYDSVALDLARGVDVPALVLALRLLVQFDGPRLERIKGVVRDRRDGRLLCVETVGRHVMPPRALRRDDGAHSSMVVIAKEAPPELLTYARRVLESAARGEPVAG